MSNPIVSTVLNSARSMQTERRNVRNLAKAIPELGAFGEFRKSWREAAKAGCDMNQLRKAVEATMGAGAGQSGIANFRDMRPFMAPEMDPEMADASGMRIAMKAMADKYLDDAPMADGCETRPIEKSDVRAHTRVTKTGRVSQVAAYTDSRKAAMDASRNAHTHSDTAMKHEGEGSHEHHVGAAKAHMAAYRAHKDAHDEAPMEVKGDHEELMRHHADASQYHMHAMDTPKAEPDTQAKEQGDRPVVKDAKDAMDASRIKGTPHWASDHAAGATDVAVAEDTPEAHAKAAQAHKEAAGYQMELHTDEDDDDAPHGRAFQAHKSAMEYHEAKAGRPIAKAHVSAHTRTVNGKVVNVAAYDDARAAAHKASEAAHKASGGTNHHEAMRLHDLADKAHTDAAKIADKDGQQIDTVGMHKTAALGHEFMANYHANAHKTDLESGKKGPHKTQDIAAIENHDDNAEFGYLGHDYRTPETDATLAEAANIEGIDKHHLQALSLGRAGRHMMDGLPVGKQEKNDEEEKPEQRAKRVNAGGKESHLAHFRDWIQKTKAGGKLEKNYGVQGYAKDLKEREGKAKGD